MLSNVRSLENKQNLIQLSWSTLHETSRPANLYAFFITDAHFDLKACWYDLSLWTTQDTSYASVHMRYSNQATEKEEEFDQSTEKEEEFDQSEQVFFGFAFKSFSWLCVRESTRSHSL